MPADLGPALNEAIHDLINLYLYPQCTFMLGQSDRYWFGNADIVLKRTGNPYRSGKNALTYRYAVDGPGFSLNLLAIWDDPDRATADVRVLAISPNDDGAVESLQAWLTALATARMPPRDLFGQPGSTT